MYTNNGTVFAVAGGFLLGAILPCCLGATNAPATVTPHYSVQYTGALTLITDNETNKLYTYQNGPGGSELRSVLDLSQTGKAELIGVTPNDAKK